jgi:phosphoadenosine phosphosulfate reductase
MNDPMEIMKRCRGAADSCLVAFSGGKDALVTLDAAKKMFDRVAGYFMFTVPGLKCQENYLRLIEARYEIEILRVPHIALTQMLKFSMFRFHSNAAEELSLARMKDIKNYARSKTGIDLVLSGEKKCDNLNRRGYISQCNGLDLTTDDGYPLADWSQRHVWSYIQTFQLPVSPTYAFFGQRSFEPTSFTPERVERLKRLGEHYPEDLELICEYFPFIKALLLREKVKDEASPAPSRRVIERLR